MDIASVIKKQGFTQEQVAEKMNINRVNLNTSIKGNPTIGTLRRIAEAIGVPITAFFEDEQPAKADTAILRCPHCGKELRIVPWYSDEEEL